MLAARKTLLQLEQEFNFKKIIQDLEELVLADSGKDGFNEIFKLIFAKIWDEKETQENRKDKTVEFGKVTARRIVKGAEKLVVDADLTFDRVNSLFHRACDEWPGIFKQGEDIELAKRHLPAHRQRMGTLRQLRAHTETLGRRSQPMSEPGAIPAERDPDLVNAEIALNRAARLVREEARRTGAALAYIEDGKLKIERPCDAPDEESTRDDGQ